MKNSHRHWRQRWVTPKAKNKKSSIHGIGAYALQTITQGEVVSVYGGVIVPASEIYSYRKKFGHLGIQVEDDFFICPSSREELIETGIFNHSCRPNLGFLNSITLIAMTDIQIDIELVLDYAFSESLFEPFKCSCNDQNCRKIIKPDDWKIKKLQDQYGKYFAPYLKKRFLSK